MIVNRMRRRKLTLIELMIAITLSSVVFSMMMISLLQMSYLTRDLITDFSLGSFARLARYQLLRGTKNYGGLATAESFQYDDSSDQYNYSSYDGEYLFSKDSSGYNQVTVSLSDRLNMSSSLASNDILIKHINVDQGKTSAFIKNGCPVVRLRLQRNYMGKNYSIEQVVRTTAFSDRE